MKKHLLLITTSLSISFIISMHLQAEGDPGHKPHGKEGGPKGGEKGRAAILKKFDANNDGKLDETEEAAAKADREKQREKMLLKKFDANKNGALDPEEKIAAEAAMAERKKKADKNGDGVLDEAEKKAAMQEHGKEPKGEKEGKGDKGLDE